MREGLYNKCMRWAVVPALAFLALSALSAGGAAARAPILQRAVRKTHTTMLLSHMDKRVNPAGCAGCHAGVGKRGTPMLRASWGKVCLGCHGPKGKAKADIKSTLIKPSHHPILETSRFHRMDEVLPEDSTMAPRHVTCVDCHVVHVSSEASPLAGVSGYRPDKRGMGRGSEPQGLRLKRASYEYELCYNCHSDSANLPSTTRNIAVDFNPDNASYHPVEAVGKNGDVPSLIPTLRPTSTVTCTDCHGNDDRYGPQGPHGSGSAPLLVAPYRTDDGPETERAYELCYMCHQRTSILSDKSFKRHSYHIVAKQTSCFTCHASHGTQRYDNLIAFNSTIVRPSTNSSGPFYFPSYGTGWPKCYLNCHGAEHWRGGVDKKEWP